MSAPPYEAGFVFPVAFVQTARVELIWGQISAPDLRALIVAARYEMRRRGEMEDGFTLEPAEVAFLKQIMDHDILVAGHVPNPNGVSPLDHAFATAQITDPDRQRAILRALDLERQIPLPLE